MRLRDVLDKPGLRLRLLAGAQHVDRPVRRVYTTDLLDPGRYLSGGELVLTGLMWRRTPEDSETFVAALAAAEVCALGAGDAALGSVPADLVDACHRHSLPLFEVPVEVSFRTITEEVAPALWAERASGLATVLGRHRDLIAAMAGGARLTDLLPRVAAELGVVCWLLTPTGRLVAASRPMADDERAAFAHAYLTADRLPHQAVNNGRRITLLPVGGRPDRRLTGWFLVVEAVDGPTPEGPRGQIVQAPTAGTAPEPEAVEELVALAALDRAQHDEARRVERRLAGQLLRSLESTVDQTELSARLVACGLPPDAELAVVVATLGGPVEDAVAVVEELVRTGDEPAAVAPLADGAAVGAVLAAAPGLPDRLRARVDTLAAGLGPPSKGPTAGTAPDALAVGVSEPARGPAALRAALDEARHAHGFAAARRAAAVVVPANELASHLLLLAGVPAAARRAFRERLLGPLVAYDRAHGADLLHTLDEFLRASGSWTRCAQTLHVHVNTLRYRIHRIEDLTGRDLDTFADRVDLFLALRLPPT